MWWQLWWVWASIALGFVILEVLAPSFVALGVAIGAAAVGLGALVLTYGSLPPVLVGWGVLSVVAYLGLRQWVGVREGQVKTWDDRDINDH